MPACRFVWLCLLASDHEKPQEKSNKYVSVKWSTNGTAGGSMSWTAPLRGQGRS